MPVSALRTIPEQGQIVTVRQRPFVVTDVLASQLPPSPLTPQQQPQRLLTLTSNATPAGSGKYAVDSLCTQAVHTLTPH